MPNSLKSKLSKLRYKGEITNEEYKELIDKLNGHDEKIRTEEREKTIDECINAIKGFCGGLPNNNLIATLEHLKEQKNE